MKQYRMLFLGIINVIHAMSHVFQVIQSFFLTSYSLNHEENWVHRLMESPWMSIVWITLAIVTIYLGIRDFKHHKQHKD